MVTFCPLQAFSQCVHLCDVCTRIQCALTGMYVHTCAACECTCVPPQGLAHCFGICAISHLDDTLAQLEDFVKSDVFRKSVGIFNIFKVQRSS